MLKCLGSKVPGVFDSLLLNEAVMEPNDACSPLWTRGMHRNVLMVFVRNCR